MTFLLFVFLVTAPCMIMSMQSSLYTNIDTSYNPYIDSDIRFFWLLYPLVNNDASRSLPEMPFLIYGAIGYLLGLLVYPITSSVFPGGRTSKKQPERMIEGR